MPSFPKQRPAFTLIELLVAISIISILIGLLLSAVQKARAAVDRVSCQNKMKQLALALHHYHDQFQSLPTGHRSRLNPDFLPFSGWTLSILPFIEQNALYEESRLAYQNNLDPFHGLLHNGLHTVVKAYICPSDGRITSPQISLRTQTLVAFTSYLGVSGDDYLSKDGMLYQNSRIRFADVTDGLSQTLFIGERPPSHDFQLGWWYAGSGQQSTGSGDLVLGVRELNIMPIVAGSSCGRGKYPFAPSRIDDPCGQFHYWSLHPGGANFSIGDGSVRFLRYEAKDLMPALASRAGGETESIPD